MMKAEPWQRAEIAGPKKALLILKPETIVAFLKRSSKPILIVGSLAIETNSIDYAIKISKIGKIPIVATANTINEFVKRAFNPSGFMSAMDIANRLNDPEWKGLDGKGKYDLALFLGLHYYMEFVILAGLKHFSPELKTISLNRYYNPHASFSYPNLPEKKWIENFKVIIDKLGEK